MQAEYELHFRTIRHARDETLAEVAQDLRVSIGWLSEVEQGKGDPRLSHLARWVRRSGKHPLEFVTIPGWDCPCCCHRQRAEETPHA